MIRLPLVETGSQFTLTGAKHSNLIKGIIESRFEQNDGGHLAIQLGTY